MDRGSQHQPIPDLEVYRFTGCEKYEVNADISFIVAVREHHFTKKSGHFYMSVYRVARYLCAA